jgi:hypothetical protein
MTYASRLIGAALLREKATAPRPNDPPVITAIPIGNLPDTS